MDAIAGHSTSKLRAAAGRYREAGRGHHTPASAQSRRGLDWMNFFHRGRADRVWLVRGVLSRTIGLVAHPYRACAIGRRRGRHAQSDPGRRPRRRGDLEARLGGRRHRHDRCRCAHFRLRAGHGVGVHRASSAGCDCRHYYAGDRRDQSRSGRTKRYVGAHRRETTLFRRRPCTDRRADGCRRRIHRQGRDLRCCCRALHSSVDRAQFHSQR